VLAGTTLVYLHRPLQLQGLLVLSDPSLDVILILICVLVHFLDRQDVTLLPDVYVF